MDNKARDFVRALLAASGVSRTGDEFCKQIVHKIAPGNGVIAALIAKVADDSKIRVFGQYGPWALPPENSIVDIWGKSPISQAIRFGNSIEISGSEAEKTKLTTPYVEGAACYLFMPFTENPRSIGVLALAFMADEPKIDSEVLDLELIRIAAEYFTSRPGLSQGLDGRIPVSFKNSHVDEGGVQFTEREKQILIQMSEGKTNFQIGRKLSLAESTVKQETVRIFKKLGVNNRKDAWILAKQRDFI